jgi:Uma2 family endonuclease
MFSSDLNALLGQQALQGQDPECRYIIDRVNWEQYEALLARNGDTSAYRVTYLDGALEIMSPSRRHENRKSRIGNLLEIYFLEADINYFPFGSTTLRREEKSGGTEPDEAYCIGTDKEFPDLAIEAIVTSGGVNKLEVYTRLNVKEVWFWQNDRFSLYYLREETPDQFIPTAVMNQLLAAQLSPIWI